MDALSGSRKRKDESLASRQPHINAPSAKRLKHSSPTPEWSVSSSAALLKLSLYPPPASSLSRKVHAPEPQKFGSFRSAVVAGGVETRVLAGEREGNLCSRMGNAVSSPLERLFRKFDEAKRAVFDSLRYPKGKEVIELADEEPQKEVIISEDSSVETIEINDGLNGVCEVVTNFPESFISELSNGHLVEAEKPEEALVSTPSDKDAVNVEDLSKDAYKKLLENIHMSDQNIKNLEFNIQLNLDKLASLRLQRPAIKPEQEVPHEPFVPLTDEEEDQVRHALSHRGRKVLSAHQSSGIEITAEVLQCLRPKAWLNDEVINLYLELLKEREKREPKKFLKCHFFNTFFYKKLTSGKDGYDYKSVRRWTTQRKLGYNLIDCDKIFVPIHQQVHWCLAVINKKEEKFQYLDSLGGRDVRVLRALSRYIVDEVKDKNGMVINVDSWEQEYVEELPEQENSYDCGVFMIKYADFYSRGLGLCFSQEHMPYFRQRTAKEILNLRAD